MLMNLENDLDDFADTYKTGEKRIGFTSKRGLKRTFFVLGERIK